MTVSRRPRVWVVVSSQTVTSGVIVGLMVGWVGLWLGSQALAFQQTSSDWAYMPQPIGEDLVICPDRMPAGAVQRIEDGAAVWNYAHFQFTFARDACLSDGRYPLLNNVSQIDFGPLPLGLLAQTTEFFLATAPNQTIECDIRFTDAVRWYTGTATPAANEYDWWSVAAHEMGHCLGLDEEPNVLPPAVEYPALATGTVRRQLTADDIAGRNAIYGPTEAASSTLAASAPSGGGGGGCSLRPDSQGARMARWAAVGNIGLPVGVLLVICLHRIISRGLYG